MKEEWLALKLMKANPRVLVCMFGRADTLLELDKMLAGGHLTREEHGMILLQIAAVPAAEDKTGQHGPRELDWEYD